MAYGLGRRSKEMTSAVPNLAFLCAHQPQPRLMHQRRGLERLARLFLSHPHRRQLAQFIIYERQ